MALEELESGPRSGERQVDPEAALLAVADVAVARLGGVIEPERPLRVPLALGGARMTLDLAPWSVRAPGFEVEVRDKGGSRFLDPGPVRTVRGSILEVPGSVAVGAVKPSGLELTIELPGGGVLELEPVARSLPGAAPDLYAISPCGGDMTKSAACGNTENVAAERRPEPLSFSKSTGQNCASLGGCLAHIVYDTDSAFYSVTGNTDAQAQATVEAILAKANERFAEFKIRHEISRLVLRPDPSMDPYADPGLTTIAALRTEVATIWNQPPPGVDMDVVQLLSSRMDVGNGGQSNVASVCNAGANGGYGVAVVFNSLCNNSGIAIHELGHNWGAHHTTCGIMQPNAGDCNAAWCGAPLTEIPAYRELVDGICLDLIPSRDARIVSQSVPASMVGGQQYAASVTVENTGVTTWSPIGAQCNAYRLAQMGSTAWTPIRVELPAALPPGQQVKLEFSVTAPVAGGTHDFRVQMVQECVTYFGSQSPNVVVNVQPAPVKDADFVSQSVPSTMVAGQQVPVSVTVQNSGNVTWSPIGAQCNAYRLAQVGSTAWTPSRVDFTSQVFASGQVTLNFNLTAPSTPGTYTFQLRMVHECVEFFGDSSPAVEVTVTP